MTYYAKTNTADPRVGFIGRGEVLTEKQAGALGENKLEELLKRGVLGRMDDAEPTPEPAADAEAAEAEADAPDGTDEPDDGEELPRLDITDDMVGESAPRPGSKAWKGGRGKSK